MVKFIVMEKIVGFGSRYKLFLRLLCMILLSYSMEAQAYKPKAFLNANSTGDQACYVQIIDGQKLVASFRNDRIYFFRMDNGMMDTCIRIQYKGKVYPDGLLYSKEHRMLFAYYDNDSLEIKKMEEGPLRAGISMF